MGYELIEEDLPTEISVESLAAALRERFSPSPNENHAPTIKLLHTVVLRLDTIKDWESYLDDPNTRREIDKLIDGRLVVGEPELSLSEERDGLRTVHMLIRAEDDFGFDPEADSDAQKQMETEKLRRAWGEDFESNLRRVAEYAVAEKHSDTIMNASRTAEGMEWLLRQCDR